MLSGHAKKTAEELHKSQERDRKIKETLPKAWKKLIEEHDETLIDLIAETTEEMCGYKPSNLQVASFFKIQPEPPIKPIPPPLPKTKIQKERTVDSIQIQPRSRLIY